MITFINEHFVPVRIKDRRENLMSQQLGISQEGYPNIAVYGADDGYLGRVIGFGGTESWFAQLQDVQTMGRKLDELRAAAKDDPSKLVELARTLADIPTRAPDAMEVLESAPASLKKSKDFKEARVQIAAAADWVAAERTISEAMEGVRSREAAVGKAPVVLEAVNAYLEAHGDVVAPPVARALATKGFFLFLADRRDEAIEVTKQLLEKHPDSPQVEQILGRLPWQ